jgi:hypothetical protein
LQNKKLIKKNKTNKNLQKEKNSKKTKKKPKKNKTHKQKKVKPRLSKNLIASTTHILMKKRHLKRFNKQKKLIKA